MLLGILIAVAISTSACVSTAARAGPTTSTTSAAAALTGQAKAWCRLHLGVGPGTTLNVMGNPTQAGNYPGSLLGHRVAKGSFEYLWKVGDHQFLATFRGDFAVNLQALALKGKASRPLRCPH